MFLDEVSIQTGGLSKVICPPQSIEGLSRKKLAEKEELVLPAWLSVLLHGYSPAPGTLAFRQSDPD